MGCQRLIPFRALTGFTAQRLWAIVICFWLLGQLGDRCSCSSPCGPSHGSPRSYKRLLKSSFTGFGLLLGDLQRRNKFRRRLFDLRSSQRHQRETELCESSGSAERRTTCSPASIALFRAIRSSLSFSYWVSPSSPSGMTTDRIRTVPPVSARGCTRSFHSIWPTLPEAKS